MYNQEEKLRERWQFGHLGSQALLTVCRSLTKSSWAWWVTTTVLQIAINKKNSWILWEFGELLSGRSKFTLFKLLRHIREISRSRPGSSFRFSITWWERERTLWNQCEASLTVSTWGFVTTTVLHMAIFRKNSCTVLEWLRAAPDTCRPQRLVRAFVIPGSRWKSIIYMITNKACSLLSPVLFYNLEILYWKNLKISYTFIYIKSLVFIN